MVEPRIYILPEDILEPTNGGHPRLKLPAVQSSVQHPLTRMDPRTLELPAPNWIFYMEKEKSLLICEMIIPDGRGLPCVRKHVHVDVTTGTCISYVMGRKISEGPAVTKTDVENCVVELQMLHACVGGPPVTKYPPSGRSNAFIDPSGNWRHRSCRLAAAWTGVPCNACGSLEAELKQTPSTSKKQAKSSDARTPKRVVISKLSQWKQSQIVSLRKRRTSWSRKRRNAEVEMERIDEMITEISEEPEDGMVLEDDD